MNLDILGPMLVSILSWAIGGMVILLLARYGYRLIAPFDVEKELIQDRNVAVGLSKAMFMVAVGIILHGLVSGPSVFNVWWQDVLTTLALLVVCFLLLWVGRIVLIKMAPYDFNEQIHIKDNLAVGVVEGGYYVAFAIVIHAAL